MNNKLGYHHSTTQPSLTRAVWHDQPPRGWGQAIWIPPRVQWVVSSFLYKPRCRESRSFLSYLVVEGAAPSFANFAIDKVAPSFANFVVLKVVRTFLCKSRGFKSRVFLCYSSGRESRTFPCTPQSGGVAPSFANVMVEKSRTFLCYSRD